MSAEISPFMWGNGNIRAAIAGSAYILQPSDLFVAFSNVLPAAEATDARATVMIVDFERSPASHYLIMAE